MGIVGLIKGLFSRVFGNDPELAAKRAELKKLLSQLADLHPPYYRPRQNLILPGFPENLYAFARAIRPLAELVRSTVGNSDQRVAQRFLDHLVECRLSPASLERRRSFSYDGMADRLRNSLDPDHELELLNQDFQAHLRELEGLGSRRIDEELHCMARFVDIARYDYERILALFDPGVSFDNPNRRADFSPAEAERVLPDLLDLHYVLEGFVFEQHLRENFVRLIARRSGEEESEAVRRKVSKIVAQADKILTGGLAPWVLLLLIRVIKGEPDFKPSLPRDRQDYTEKYRHRLVNLYGKDRERLERERHESTVSADIATLFGTSEIEVIEGYDEETDAYLRRESPNSFLWIKPLRVLKTFIRAIFEPVVKEPLQRLLVEGYFDNKAFQNNVANILYQCQRTAAKIEEFEASINSSGRVSITAMRRYAEELRRGKDLGSYLTRIVDTINAMAFEIAREEAGVFVVLGDAMHSICADAKRPNPEVITNIRTLGGARNKEIIAQLVSGRDRLAILARIMRNFGVVRPAAPEPVQEPPAALI